MSRQAQRASVSDLGDWSPDRQAWLSAAFAELGEAGRDRLSAGSVAARLGVPRACIHHHFTGIDDLARVLVCQWERSCLERLSRAVAPSDPAAEARAALTGLCGVPNRFESALRGWARHNGAVAAAMARVDEARTHHLATALAPLVDDPRVRRELAVGAVNAVIELQRLRPRPGHDRYIAALREFATSLPAIHDWPADPHGATVGSNTVPLPGSGRPPGLGLAGTRK
ncbi:MAG TPA: TetR family transcriptional regulator [Sporichthyaceae bacterium]|nr:TetR family transcriptional regulator [Sporichthyaceae bacterium]